MRSTGPAVPRPNVVPDLRRISLRFSSIGLSILPTAVRRYKGCAGQQSWPVVRAQSPHGSTAVWVGGVREAARGPKGPWNLSDLLHEIFNI